MNPDHTHKDALKSERKELEITIRALDMAENAIRQMYCCLTIIAGTAIVGGVVAFIGFLNR